MKSGYSYATLAQNIDALQKAGTPRRIAIKSAFAHARVSFFKAHAKGALPAWLAYPRSNRMREHYNTQGEPSQESTRGAFRANPSKPIREIAEARKLFADFTGHEPGEAVRISLPAQPKAGLVFGTLIQVGYRSARDGRLYRHTFRTNSSRPLLIASSDGKSLHIVGGRYAFTDRGIEDK
jgi:hypothetical protein